MPRATGGEILAGLELDRGRSEWSPLSLGMARLAVGRALRCTAGRWRNGQAGSQRKQARRAGSALLALAVGVGLLAAVFPRLSSTQWTRFVAAVRRCAAVFAIQFALQPGNVQVRYGSSLEVFSTVTVHRSIASIWF